MAVRRRPRLKFFVILGVVIALFAVLLGVLLREQPTAAVEWAVTEYEANFDMLIVRSETVYAAKDYGMTDFITEEGEHVEPGDRILQVYERGYNDGTLSELLEKQKTIITYETEVRLEGIINEELNDINSRIDAKALDIQQAVSSGHQEALLGLERDMETLLNERMTYLKSAVVANDTLREHYDEEEQILELIRGWRTDIVAEQSGVVSFYFDGCEAVMSKENIGSFTKDVIEEVSKGKTIETAEEDTAYAPLYRIVNPNEWYVVMVSDKHIPEMFEGNIYTIVFDDYLETQYTGMVYNVKKLEENNGYVYTILIQDDIGPLLGDRRVKARVYTKIEGMRLPASCLRTKDDIDYVETETGEYVPVIVIADDEPYIYVKTYEGQPGLEIGQELKN